MYLYLCSLQKYKPSVHPRSSPSSMSSRYSMFPIPFRRLTPRFPTLARVLGLSPITSSINFIVRPISGGRRFRSNNIYQLSNKRLQFLKISKMILIICRFFYFIYFSQIVVIHTIENQNKSTSTLCNSKST